MQVVILGKQVYVKRVVFEQILKRSEEASPTDVWGTSVLAKHTAGAQMEVMVLVIRTQGGVRARNRVKEQKAVRVRPESGAVRPHTPCGS